MNYRLAQDMIPMLPCHAPPRLHEGITGNLPPTAKPYHEDFHQYVPGMTPPPPQNKDKTCPGSTPVPPPTSTKKT